MSAHSSQSSAPPRCSTSSPAFPQCPPRKLLRAPNKPAPKLKAQATRASSLPREYCALRQCFSAIDFIGRARVKPFLLRAGEGDAHARFVRRFLNHSAQTTDRVEHLDAGVTGNVIAALFVGRHAVSAAVGPSFRNAQIHITLPAVQ